MAPGRSTASRRWPRWSRAKAPSELPASPYVPRLPGSLAPLVGLEVGNDKEKYWRMANGYCLPQGVPRECRNVVAWGAFY